MAGLEKVLELPQATTNKMSLEIRTAFLENHVAKIIRSQKLSPEAEEEVNAIILSLDVDLSNQLKQTLQKLKIYWNIEHNELSIIQTDIMLQKSEYCHFQAKNVSWFEFKTINQRKASTTHQTEEMKLLDKGNLYLTNKRILLVGLKKNSTIRIDKILSITSYSNGVEINKGTIKNLILQLPSEADIFYHILKRLSTKQTNS